MTKQDCLRTARHVVRAYGFANFSAIYELVINRGYRAEDGRGLLEFRRIERAFHTAQMLRWAAEEYDLAARRYWVGVAAKRLGATSVEQWRALPAELKAAA